VSLFKSKSSSKRTGGKIKIIKNKAKIAVIFIKNKHLIYKIKEVVIVAKKTIKKVKKSKSRRKSQKSLKLPAGKKMSKKTTWLVVGLFIVVIIALVFFFYSKGFVGRAYVTECDTAVCLIEQANECKPAEYIVNIGTSTIKMEILSGCRLKKTIIKLDETEPVEIRDFFKGKSMTCTYEKGEFNNDFAYQISGPLDECEGSLKDAIEAVV